jgi:NADPH-dependent 7-cyano-7-deazaguanine reductase QueF
VIEFAHESGVRIRYVPDRLVLTRESFMAYLRARHREMREILPEAFAVSVAEDIANEIVPKWLQVTFAAEGLLRHAVTVEDRQPGWDHPTLLRGL